MSSNTDKLPSNYHWNFRAFVVDFVFFAMAMTFINSSSVLPAFIRELTDSTVAIGLAGTVFSGGWFLPQLLVARLIGHKPRKKPYLIAALPARGLFLVIAAALWAGMARYPAAMLAIFFVCLALFAIGDGFTSVPWYDLLARTIPANRRGRLFGLSQVIKRANRGA